MKTIFYLFILIFFVSLFTVSCSKKESAQNTTAQKLQYKWSFLNVVDNDHYSGTDHSVTINGNPGDYMDFRANGKVYLNLQSQMDSSTYTLVGDNKIIFDGTDTATIKTLTNNSLQLYLKDIYNSPDYEEITYNLSR